MRFMSVGIRDGVARRWGPIGWEGLVGVVIGERSGSWFILRGPNLNTLMVREG